MMAWRLLAEGLCALLATAFFALSLKGPRRTIPAAALLGLLGQILYSALKGPLGDNASVFLAAFAVCMLAELLTRRLKAPATVISFPAVIPLVPGVMLYLTMLRFAVGDYEAGSSALIATIIYAGCMAIAITLAAMIAKHFFPARLREKRTENDK